MANHQFFYPLLNWERPYRGEICTGLNVERYSLRKDGNISYHHPTGTHDDVFWSIALAVYATAEMGPSHSSRLFHDKQVFFILNKVF